MSLGHLEAQINSFVFGSLAGSFLNVLIYRLPRNEDMVLQRSSCPHCKHQLTWYELVPIFSYIFLLGRCKVCKIRISPRYPITELIIALGALFLLPSSFDLSSTSVYLFYLLNLFFFVAHFQIDLAHKILPDSLNLILLTMYLSFGFFHFHWTHWLVGGALGFLFPLGITWLFYLLRGQVGLGGGDIKLFGILGIYLGPLGVIQNIFISCFIGAIVGGILIWRKKMEKSDTLPFGPFIIVVASIQIYFPHIFDKFTKLIL